MMVTKVCPKCGAPRIRRDRPAYICGSYFYYDLRHFVQRRICLERELKKFR